MNCNSIVPAFSLLDYASSRWKIALLQEVTAFAPNRVAMSLGICKWGIVLRKEGGETAVYIPGRNGTSGTQIEVDSSLADELRLSTGDLLQGWTLADPEGEAGPKIISAEFVNGLNREQAIDRPQPRPRRHT